MKAGIAALACIAASAQSVPSAEHGAERAFAELLFGRYYADPCANISRGSQSCAPVFSDKRMEFADEKARQTYRFEENRCVIHADTVISATGERYAATFNLQNVLYVNLNKAQQEGNLMEIELFLQGSEVIKTGGKARNVLVFIHKYFATSGGDIGHPVKDEVIGLRRALKAYQVKFCGGFG